MCRFQTWYRHCKIHHFECNALEYMSPPDNAPHLNAFMVWCLCINSLLDKLLQTDVHFYTLLTYTFHIATETTIWMGESSPTYGTVDFCALGGYKCFTAFDDIFNNIFLKLYTAKNTLLVIDLNVVRVK